MHGCASRVRLSDPRARSSPSSGWRVGQHVMLTPPIAAASTLSCTRPLRLARRCVATSPLTREGIEAPAVCYSRWRRHHCRRKAQARCLYPELLRPGPQRLCVRACEAGGRWSAESLCLVTQLVRLRAQRAPAALRPAARQGWLRRLWGFLSVALQSTLAAMLLGAPYVAGALPGAPLADVLHDAAPPAPSHLGP